MEKTYTCHRTFDHEAVIKVDESLDDIDWTSHVTVSLYYRPRLIGEVTLRDTYFIPDASGKASIKLERFDIRNMVGFKNFMQHLLPNEVDIEIETANGLTVTGRSVDEAHELSLNIELSGISKASVKDFYFRLVERTVIIEFNFSSPSPVVLDFGDCEFSLERGGEVLARLDGYFRIGLEDPEVLLQGDAIAADTRFSGFGTLRGVKALEESNTWVAHAIRSFEMSVDLDRKTE